MSKKKEILIVIPARYGSTRLPGKALLQKTGKYLVQHVYERVCGVNLDARIVVATDDRRIFTAVRHFGGEAVMTSRDCRSGTDRACQVARMEPAADIVVNVQGDEPEIEPGNVETLVALLRPAAGDPLRMPDIATLACAFSDGSEFADPSKVKVLLTSPVRKKVGRSRCFGDALYFSRAMVPYWAGASPSNKSEPPQAAYRHLGLYAFRRAALLAFAETRETDLERMEKLEQLRALESGMTIRVGIVPWAPGGIDTPADYADFVRRHRARTLDTGPLTFDH